MTWLAAISLFSAVFAHLIITIRDTSHTLYHNLRTDAHIIGTSSSASIVLNDMQFAHNILRSFENKGAIRKVCLYSEDELLFTSFINESHAESAECPVDMVTIHHDFERAHTARSGNIITDIRVILLLKRHKNKIIA